MDWSQHTQQLVIHWLRRYLVAPLYFYDAWVAPTQSDAKGLSLVYTRTPPALMPPMMPPEDQQEEALLQLM